jgi:hypothetical protein
VIRLIGAGGMGEGLDAAHRRKVIHRRGGRRGSRRGRHRIDPRDRSGISPRNDETLRKARLADPAGCLRAEVGMVTLRPFVASSVPLAPGVAREQRSPASLRG